MLCSLRWGCAGPCLGLTMRTSSSLMPLGLQVTEAKTEAANRKDSAGEGPVKHRALHPVSWTAPSASVRRTGEHCTCLLSRTFPSRLQAVMHISLIVLSFMCCRRHGSTCSSRPRHWTAAAAADRCSRADRCLCHSGPNRASVATRQHVR